MDRLGSLHLYISTAIASGQDKQDRDAHSQFFPLKASLTKVGLFLFTRVTWVWFNDTSRDVQKVRAGWKGGTDRPSSFVRIDGNRRRLCAFCCAHTTCSLSSVYTSISTIQSQNDFSKYSLNVIEQLFCFEILFTEPTNRFPSLQPVC